MGEDLIFLMIQKRQQHTSVSDSQNRSHFNTLFLHDEIIFQIIMKLNK